MSEIRSTFENSKLTAVIGMGLEGKWEGGSGWGTHVNPWLLHVNVWQKTTTIL